MSLLYVSEPLASVITAIVLITNERMTGAEIVKCWSSIMPLSFHYFLWRRANAQNANIVTFAF